MPGFKAKKFWLFPFFPYNLKNVIHNFINTTKASNI